MSCALGLDLFSTSSDFSTPTKGFLKLIVTLITQIKSEGFLFKILLFFLYMNLVPLTPVEKFRILALLRRDSLLVVPLLPDIEDFISIETTSLK